MIQLVLTYQLKDLMNSFLKKWKAVSTDHKQVNNLTSWIVFLSDGYFFLFTLLRPI